MTMSTELFRREALEHHLRPPESGGVLRVGAPWVRWLYWLVLAMVGAGLVVSLTVRVDRTTSGPALVDPQQGTFVAVLPAAAGAEVRGDHPLRLELDGPGQRTVAASVGEVRAADDAAVRRAGFDSFPRSAVLVTGVLEPDAVALDEAGSSPRRTGRAVVVVGSEQAFSLLLGGFHDVSEGGNG
ncbi:hypothetical protein [Geodermatophilus sp. URMC 65]